MPKESYNIKIGYKAILTVETPNGLTTTIIPSQNLMPDYKENSFYLEQMKEGK